MAEIAEVLSILASVAIGIGALIAGLNKAGKKQTQSAQDKVYRSETARPAPYKNPAAQVFENSYGERKKQTTSIDFKKYAKAEPGHATGGKTEKVEPIVGSLGEHNDEGCGEHASLRFITTESTDESEPTLDYEKIAAAMIFGSVLSQPKGDENLKHF